MAGSTRSLCVRLAGAICYLVTATGLAAAGAPTVDDCDDAVIRAPRDPESYRCYLRAARAHGTIEEAVRRLDALLEVNPKLARARLILALIEDMRDGERTEALFRQAADELAEVGDLTGEVHARRALAWRLGRSGRLEEADDQLDRALGAADAADDDGLRAWVWAEQASQATRRMDHGEARRLFRRAERVVFPEGDSFLQGYVLSGLGGACWHMGDLQAALDYFRRDAELKRRAGDRWGESAERYNIALLATQMAYLGRMGEEQATALCREALEVAVQAGNPGAEADARMLFGQRLDGPEGLAEQRRALEIGLQTNNVRVTIQARRIIAVALLLLDPPSRSEAFEILDHSIDAAREIGDRYHLARGLILRAAFFWNVDLREEALTSYEEAFEAIELIRELQPESEVRARVFSRWTYPYYRLSGRLLGSIDRSSRPDDDLDLAFRTIERMRARMLLDHLDAAGVKRADPARDDPLHGERADVLGRIADLQAELMRHQGAPPARREILGELEQLENREVDLRDRIARSDPSLAVLSSRATPSLGDLQAALEEDQAVLTFQVPDDRYQTEPGVASEGGEWAVVVTRDDVSVHPLPRIGTLEQQVDVFLGLFRLRDGSDGPASTGLYRDLVAEAIDSLPSHVTRLVIVPDHVLHRLPFEALRERDDGPPLASRFEISYAPSATSWLHWKRADAPLAGAGVLAMVDPELPERDPDLHRAADASWIESMKLGSLPHSRREARALLRAMGAGELREGARASERYLKSVAPDRFGIVYLAAHALADERRPSRSAVVLASGSPEEDGLLQMREIVDLELDGKVVVLAACHSASGEVLTGEGVVGLAQAFFRAGARAVIGSRWPVRDAETAAMMETFAVELGRGQSVAGALAAARRSSIEAGAPAESWAGLVVLGDGDVVPLPVSAKRPRRGWIVAVFLGVPLLMFLGIRWWTARAR